MNAVGNHRVLGVLGLGLGLHVQHDVVQTDVVHLLLVGKFLAARGVLAQRVVVVGPGTAAVVIDASGPQQDHANVGLLEFRHQAGHTFHEPIESLLGEGAVSSVVHAEADRHDGGLLAEHVPLQPAQAAGRGVAAPSGVAEGHVQPRIPQREVVHHVAGVNLLLGDAVAQEHHPVAGLERALGPGGRSEQT